MNRTHRRASTRTHARARSARLDQKHSHRLPPQICVLYVQGRGYLESFSCQTVRTVESAELAKLYEEDEASTAALAFREVTGLRVAIRPFYARPV